MKGIRKAIRKHILSLLNESRDFDLTQCPLIKLTKDIISEVNKFNYSEELLRAGGLSNETLDRAAFGFTDEDIKTLMPKQLNIKWKDDLENVIWEQEKSGLSKQDWAKKIKLTEPIDVSYENDKFWIEDGHHRYWAAKILKLPLNVNLEIKQNPITKLAPDLDYDDFHRCIFKQVKSLNKNLNESNGSSIFNSSIKQEMASAAQTVYDSWEQNEEGYDEMLGEGGICQDIADALCNVMSKHNIECTTVSQSIGDQHVYSVAKIEDGVYEVDINPYHYETGGGYNWKKIPDVVFDERFIHIQRLSADPEEFNQYTEDY